MALSQRLQIRQSQSLVMTPQLMQAIKLLQLSSLDLSAYVDAELERNPLLERSDDGEAPVAETEAPAAAADEWQSDGGESGDDGAFDGGAATAEDYFDPPGDNAIADRADGSPHGDASPEAAYADDGDANPEHASIPDSPAYSEWSVAKGGREDGEYNLEAFVESETTL